MNYREALQRLTEMIRRYRDDREDVMTLSNLEPEPGCHAVQAHYLLLEAAEVSPFEVIKLCEELELCALYYAIYAHAADNQDVPITDEDIEMVEGIIATRVHTGELCHGEIRALAERIYPELPF